MSITGFDQHQTDSFAKEERRCRSDEELRANVERRDVGILREGKDYKEMHDVWYDVAGRETMRKVFSKGALE